MRNIAEANILLRERLKLPHGLKLATDEFREGWKFVRRFNAERLEKKMRTSGWNFIRISAGSLRSGVGDTSQQAIASALKLALRRVSERFDAVEVEHIELTQYPWFFLARVQVNPYRIQEGATLPAPGDVMPMPVVPRERRLPIHSAALYPRFGSAMPMLKQMLISTRGSEARPL